MPITTIPDKPFIEEKTCNFSNKKVPKENWSAIIYENEKIRYLYKNKNDSYGVKSFGFTGRIKRKY